jgi:hypothetical protein
VEQLANPPPGRMEPRDLGGHGMGRLLRCCVAFSLVVVALAGCDWRAETTSRWTCGSHPYWINPSGAPTGGVQMVKDAFAQANQASTPYVQWYYAGTTTASSTQTGKVVVAWAQLPNDEYGEGAPQPWPNADRGRWTGGIVLVDPSWPANLGIILHEVGHVAGLAHVTEAGEVMNGNETVHYKLSQYGPGDLVGLRTLAAQCRH